MTADWLSTNLPALVLVGVIAALALALKLWQMREARRRRREDDERYRRMRGE